MFRALDWNLVGCGLFPMQILIAWDFHKSQARYVTPLLGGHAALPPCVITQGVCYGGIQLYSFLVGCGYIQVLDWWYGDLVRYGASVPECVQGEFNGVHWCIGATPVVPKA